MAKQTYNEFYNGIIVQNNDPDHAGKVKVWVPHISPTVYQGWINKVDENKRFKFLGSNVAAQFTMIVEDLKQILPWADVALPLVSESSSGRYNATTQYGSISDSNNMAYVSADTKNYEDFESQNTDNIGEKPANIFEQESTLISDDFNSTENFTNHVNPFSYNYKPSSYSNCTKGEFGIPSVGAHVWVFFREGDVNYPVVCFASFGKTDWESIYSSNNDYPGSAENVKGEIGSYTHNVEKYRNKYVLNQKGGTLEIVNTDHNEKIKLTHYSGSFKEMNNSVTTELATGNDQKLVLGDQYTTIKGNRNAVTNGDSDDVVKGDRYVKVGNMNFDAFTKWKAEMAPVNDTRQLFDIARTDDKIIVKRGDTTILKFNSTQQKKSNKNIDNDVAKTQYTVYEYNQPIGKTSITQQTKFEQGTDTAFSGKDPQTLNKSAYLVHNARITVSPSAEVKLPDISPSSMGSTDVASDKNIQKLLGKERIQRLFNAEQQMGIGGSEIKNITKDKLETIGLALNDFGSIRIDSAGKYYPSDLKISRATSFVNKTATPLIEYVYVDDFPGGTYTLNVNNKFNVLVGAGGINMKSYGCTNIGGTITNVSGEQVNIGSRNEINIASDKRISISAEVLILRQKHQKQVLVDSSLGISRNLVIGGKSYFEQEMYLHHITAPREIQVTYPSVAHAQAIDNAELGTFELDFTNSSGPTDSGAAGAGMLKAKHTAVIKCISSSPHSIICSEHGHNFDNIPLTLLDSNEAVRKSAQDAKVDDNTL